MFGTTKHKHTTKTLTKPFYKLSKVKKKKKNSIQQNSLQSSNKL